MEMAKLPALSPRSFTALQEASEFEWIVSCHIVNFNSSYSVVMLQLNSLVTNIFVSFMHTY
jgi:hypothetical protein